MFFEYWLVCFLKLNNKLSEYTNQKTYSQIN